MQKSWLGPPVFRCCTGTVHTMAPTALKLFCGMCVTLHVQEINVKIGTWENCHHDDYLAWQITPGRAVMKDVHNVSLREKVVLPDQSSSKLC